MEDISIAHQVGASAMVVYALDALKKAQWFPWLNEHTELANRMVAIIAAFGTALGIRIVSFQGSIHDGGTVSLSFAPVSVIIETLIHSMGQFWFQENLHKLRGNHVIGKAVLDLVTELRDRIAVLENGPQKP